MSLPTLSEIERLNSETFNDCSLAFDFFKRNTTIFKTLKPGVFEKLHFNVHTLINDEPAVYHLKYRDNLQCDVIRKIVKNENLFINEQHICTRVIKNKLDDVKNAMKLYFIHPQTKSFYYEYIPPIPVKYRDTTSMKFVLSLIDVVRQFHDRHLYHGDIKFDNVFVRNGEAVLIDYNTVTDDEIGECDYDRFHRSYHYPPESLRPSGTFSMKLADYYSLGYLLYTVKYKPDYTLIMTSEDHRQFFQDIDITDPVDQIISAFTAFDPDVRKQNIDEFYKQRKYNSLHISSSECDVILGEIRELCDPDFEIPEMLYSILNPITILTPIVESGGAVYKYQFDINQELSCTTLCKYFNTFESFNAERQFVLHNVETLQHIEHAKHLEFINPRELCIFYSVSRLSNALSQSDVNNVDVLRDLIRFVNKFHSRGMYFLSISPQCVFKTADGKKTTVLDYSKCTTEKTIKGSSVVFKDNIYAPPEARIDGADVNTAAFDIYSIGMTFFALKYDITLLSVINTKFDYDNIVNQYFGNKRIF